jgi:hypothetical protein
MTQPGANAEELPAGGHAISLTRGRRLRLIIQFIGFGIGLALLGLCIALALTPENREQLQRLSEASPLHVGTLLLLSLITLNINGLIFWVVLHPARRLRMLDMLAVNAVATFLIYLPFKLSALFRIAVHNRRDRIPLLTIGAWFAAVAILLLAAITPATLAAAWRQQIDLAWLAATLAGCAALGLGLIVMARVFRGDEGQTRLVRLAGSLRIGLLRRLAGSRAWSNLHAGFSMLSSAKAVAAATLLRLADLGVLAGRFVLAAAIFGIALPFDQALLISLAYFMVGVLSPFGVLGTREAGAVGMAAALFGTAGADIAESASTFAAVALLVSATEAIVYLFCAALGLGWLRPDRLLRPPGARRSDTSIAQDHAAIDARGH